MRLDGDGISLEVPRGWDAQLYRPAARTAGEHSAAKATERAPTVVHLANFPLPPERGDFGSGAVEIMGRGGVLIILVEHPADAIDTALFARRAMPRRVRPDDFDPDRLQRPLAGQGGLQFFFQEAGRAFCLYVVIGRHRDRRLLAEVTNEVLATINISSL